MRWLSAWKGKESGVCLCAVVSGRWLRSVEVAAVVDVGFLKPADASSSLWIELRDLGRACSERLEGLRLALHVCGELQLQMECMY